MELVICQKIREERLSRLVKRLLQDTRYDDIIRVTKDDIYRKKLYHIYNIV